MTDRATPDSNLVNPLFEGRLPASPEAPPASSSPAQGLYERAQRSAGAIAKAFGGCAPQVGLVLGSGLGAFAESFEGMRFLPYADVPGFPQSTVEGHRGRLAYGTVGGVRVLAMQGRFHRYEGYPLSDVTFPVRVLGLLGVRCLIVTNASGGIAERLAPGTLMLISDHLNLQGESALEGPNDGRFGPRFPDMTECYPDALRAAARAAAPPGTPLAEGVYAALRGPAYETPAEIRMLAALGADAVGMSTVPEVTVARHMGIPCLGISAVANKAAGLITGHRLSHEEVVETMDRVATLFAALLHAAVPAVWQASGALVEDRAGR